MNHRMKGTEWKSFKLALKRGFTYGLILELMFIGTGYMLYREYTTNNAFREQVEDQFPALTEYYNTVSGLYLSVVPKRLRDQMLEVKQDESSTSTTKVENISNPTNLTTITAAALATTKTAATPTTTLPSAAPAQATLQK